MFLLKNKEPTAAPYFSLRYREVLDGVGLGAFFSIFVDVVVDEERDDGGADCGD